MKRKSTLRRSWDLKNCWGHGDPKEPDAKKQNQTPVLEGPMILRMTRQISNEKVGESPRKIHRFEH